MMRFIVVFLIFTILPIFSATAKNLKFAIVPKYQSVFFDKSGKGCQSAAAKIEGVECIYRGPKEGDVRKQDRIISELIDEGVDGIAVAVTESDFLARSSMQKAIKAGIPIITYDSDFDANTQQQYKNLRLSYIGTDNFAFGKALGEQLKKLRPNGGRLLIQTGRPDSPNLNLRIMGLRSALSGQTYHSPPGQIISNANGWTEVRTPIPNFDKTKRAVKQLESVLRAQPSKIDAFVAVGGWPQNDITRYRKIVAPFKNKIKNNELIVVIANASDNQLSMLGEHLASANIGQNPYEMGKLAVTTLYNIVSKRAYDKITYTGLTNCTPENYITCTLQSE